MSAQWTTETQSFPIAIPTVRPLVVVAEDHADERSMVGTLLGYRGFDVILTADGREALDAVLTHGPDAVVSDMEMPNLDGLGLCRALRALRAYRTLPILVYTGADVTDPRVRDAQELHSARVLSKSVSVTEIAVVLRHMLSVVDDTSVSGGAAA